MHVLAPPSIMRIPFLNSFVGGTCRIGAARLSARFKSSGTYSGSSTTSLSTINAGFVPDFTKTKVYFPEVHHEQWNALELYARLLHEWNEKINLVSRKDVQNLCKKHISVSMAIHKCRRFQPNERVIDVGSGGGLPGLPLAILNPNTEFTLLDSKAKKVRVLREMVKELGLKNVECVEDRVELHKQHKYDVCLGRGVSNLSKFLGLTKHLLANCPQIGSDNGNGSGSCGVYYIKGGDFEEELVAASLHATRLYDVEELTGVDCDKKVLFIPTKEVLNFGRMRMKHT